MRFLSILLLFLSIQFVNAQDPNDCVNSVITCGNSNINLDVQGVGTQELSGNNSCSSEEHNSLWLQVTVATSGTLGFTLTPNSTDLSEDYDFFVFGPNVSCGNIGNAIRCSTTNPEAANRVGHQNDNLTGMKDTTEDDVSEGPGEDGNSFVEWLDVLANETYFIVIDRPIGNSPFMLEWTGTATFYEAPSNDLPVGLNLSYESCDTDGDQIATFDLTQNESQVVGVQDVNVTYHKTISDAQIGTNDIVAPDAFETVSTTAFIRLTDRTTECFSVFDINLVVPTSVVLPPLDNLKKCETDANNKEIFDLSLNNANVVTPVVNPKFSYHLNENDAKLSQNELPLHYENISNPQTIWMRFEDLDSGCFGISSFNLEVFKMPIANSIQNWIACDTDNDGLFDFNFSLLDDQILAAQDTSIFVISYYTTQTDADLKNDALPLNFIGKLEDSPQQIFARIEHRNNPDCFEITNFNAIIVNSPEFDVENEKYICVNLLPQTVNFNVTNPKAIYSYSWKDTSGNELSQTSILNATINDDYTITATTTDGYDCSTTKTVHLLPAEPAIISNFIINEYWVKENFSLKIEVISDGVYQYAIDDINGLYQEDPYFVNIKPGIHEIFIKEMNGCGDVSKEVIIFGFTEFLTPNGDGVNDVWKVQGITFQPEDKIIIFNRYGKLMTSFSPALNQGWNGLYNNVPAPDGEYWFIADMKNYKGEKIIRKGHFSLIRTRN